MPERAGLARDLSGLCLGLLKSIDPWIGGQAALMPRAAALTHPILRLFERDLDWQIRTRCQNRKSMYVMERPHEELALLKTRFEAVGCWEGDGAFQRAVASQRGAASKRGTGFSTVLASQRAPGRQPGTGFPTGYRLPNVRWLLNG